jgi:hypothetical protein
MAHEITAKQPRGKGPRGKRELKALRRLANEQHHQAHRPIPEKTPQFSKRRRIPEPDLSILID